MERVVTDLSPRWICYFSREVVENGETKKDNFVLRFNQLDDMILACARAKVLGYRIKTLPASRLIKPLGP